MAKLSTILAALILAATLANAAHQPWDIRRDFSWLFGHTDSASSYDDAVRPIRHKLKERGLTRLGYRTEPGSNWNDRMAEYFLIQYSMAPVVLRPHTTQDQWVLMNYSATKKPFETEDLVPVEDFGNGLALYKKLLPTVPGSPQLGKIWHEQEGAWRGTWIRLGDSGVFDAAWKGPQGVEIHDDVWVESLTGRDIVLYRRGTKGRYRGRLSADGSKVESGRAEWFSPGDTWAATIEK